MYTHQYVHHTQQRDGPPSVFACWCVKPYMTIINIVIMLCYIIMFCGSQYYYFHPPSESQKARGLQAGRINDCCSANYAHTGKHVRARPNLHVCSPRAKPFRLRLFIFGIDFMRKCLPRISDIPGPVSTKKMPLRVT